MRSIIFSALAGMLLLATIVPCSAQTTYMDAMALFDALDQMPRDVNGDIRGLRTQSDTLLQFMRAGYLYVHNGFADGADPGERTPSDAGSGVAPVRSPAAPTRNSGGGRPSSDPYEALVDADLADELDPSDQLDRIARRMLSDLQWAYDLNAYRTANEARFMELVRSRPDGFRFNTEIRAAVGLMVPEAYGTGKGFASLMGFDQTAIINGIVDWAIDRAQEELLQAFLRRWLIDLQNDTCLRLLLPSTLNMINTGDLTGMLSQGDAWKAAFQNDLDHIPDRSDSLVILVLKRLRAQRDGGMSDALKDEIGGVAQVFASVYRELRNEKDVQTVLSVLAYRATITSATMPVSGTTGRTIAQRALIGAGALTDALRTKDDGVFGYADPMTLARMKDERFAFFWKFIAVTYPGHLKGALALDSDAQLAALAVLLDPTDPTGSKVYQVRAHLLNMLNQVHAMGDLAATSFGDLKSEDRDALDPEAAAQYLDVVLHLLDNALAFASSINPESEFTTHYSTTIEPLMQHVRHINTGVITQDYGQVVSGTLDLVEHLLHRSDSLDHTLAKLSTDVNTYLGFMVDVLTADSAEEVTAALKKVTMGTGSFRVKQTSRFSATITLLPGGFYGEETAYLRGGGDVPDSLRSTGNAAAFYLPIGISFGWGTGSKVVPVIGLFLQAVDLGSVMSYRLDAPDSMATAPNYSFEQLLSPGIALTAHVGRSPVTVGYQWSWTPALREVTTNGNIFNANTYRHGFILGVDVTAFQLFASKRKTRLGGIHERVIP